MEPVNDATAELQQVLGQSVYVRGGSRAFGQLTREDVRSRADELRAVTGFGPTARVGAVARAWAELAQELQQSGASVVSQLPGERVLSLAPRLWVSLPLG